MKTITFTNCAPSQFDSLGSLTWIAPLYCSACAREIEAGEVVMRPYYYDGYNWESPEHKACGTVIYGLPVDEAERAIFLKRRPARAEILKLLPPSESSKPMTPITLTEEQAEATKRDVALTNELDKNFPGWSTQYVQLWNFITKREDEMASKAADLLDRIRADVAMLIRSADLCRPEDKCEHQAFNEGIRAALEVIDLVTASNEPGQKP